MTSGGFKTAFLILAMIVWWAAVSGGAGAAAYADDTTSGKIIELPDADRKALSVFGKGVVGRALPAKPLVPSDTFMPLKSGAWIYDVVSGGAGDNQQTDRMARPAHDKAGDDWHRVVGNHFVEYFRWDEKKGILLATEADLKENVLTRYDPVFSVIYEGMHPGETRSAETDIRVYDLHDLTDEKYKGHLTVAHTYVGAYEISIPAGQYNAVLIKSTYTGKVGPATVNDKGYMFYAEGEGVVAAVERSHVSAFLFYDKKTRTAKVLRKKVP